MWWPSSNFYPDLAPIIAGVLLEHPPRQMPPMHRLAWVLRTWPHCSREEAIRAVRICIEIELADHLYEALR